MSVVNIETSIRDLSDVVPYPDDIFSPRGNKNFGLRVKQIVKEVMRDKSLEFKSLTNAFKATKIVSIIMSEYILIFMDGSYVTQENKKYLIDGIKNFIDHGQANEIHVTIRTSVCASRKKDNT